MPNHFHLLLAVADVPLGVPLQAALTRHAVRFNHLHGRTGHLFENRFWSSACDDIEHLENAVAYIHLNPVRAGLVASPYEWKWSSHSAWSTGAGATVDFDRLEQLTGWSPEVAAHKHSARITCAMEKSARGLELSELVNDTASDFGVSGEALRSRGSGRAYTHIKASLIARAEKEQFSLTELARELNCTPEALYMLKKRRT